MLQFSVIVPVYNVKDYLAECIDSLLAQDTAEAYEVILVDDGSTDSSGTICDAYAAQDARVRVVHQKNGGVSAARNAGIAAAQGNYLLFADPDDLWMPQLLSAVAEFVCSAPDMVVYGAESFDSTGVRNQIVPALLPKGESGPAYLERLFQIDRLPSVAVWCYVYQREFLLKNKLLFRTDLIVAEDFDFNFACLSRAGAVYGTAAILYRYRLREGSLSRCVSLKKEFQKAEIDVKWLSCYPVAAMANSWCYLAFGLCKLGSRKQLLELTALDEENRRYLRLVTDPRCRFGAFLFRTLGFYNGSAVIMALIALRHRLMGIRSDQLCTE